ncbi:transposase [Hymenobacter sp.]|uniref:transposase n=1 Tax=Hymenobacter sp. TaxID=1898978 RepID=UPI0039C8A2CB
MATKTCGSSPDKRRKCDSAFQAEALRLASESRSTQAAAQQLGISPKVLYRWQQTVSRYRNRTTRANSVSSAKRWSS